MIKLAEFNDVSADKQMLTKYCMQHGYNSISAFITQLDTTQANALVLLELQHMLKAAYWAGLESEENQDKVEETYAEGKSEGYAEGYEDGYQQCLDEHDAFLKV